MSDRARRTTGWARRLAAAESWDGDWDDNWRIRAASTDNGFCSSSLSHFHSATAAGREEDRRTEGTKYDSMGRWDDVVRNTARRFLALRREVAVEDARRFLLEEMAADCCSSSVDASLSTSMTVEAVLLLRDDERRK
jgi:hypothetical protein